MEGALERRIADIAILAEPVRRSLYLYVIKQRRLVGRDEAAEATGTTRENAAFHLDRLVGEGLLEASFRRLGRRTGPGAGRPSKLYRRSTKQLELTLPARHHVLAAELLAQGLDGRHGKGPRAGVGVAARALGRSIGIGTRARARTRPAAALLLRRAIKVLDEKGYEPVEDPRGTVRMENCPFDPLPRAHRDLVCGMNLAFIQGVLSGVGARGISATLEWQPGRCCVVLRAAP